MDALNACGYLSRVVPLPVAVAEAVFDDVTRSLGASAHADPTALGTALLIWHWRHPAAFLTLLAGAGVLLVGGTLTRGVGVGPPFLAHWTSAFPSPRTRPCWGLPIMILCAGTVLL